MENTDLVKSVSIENELKKCYLDYAMSVIVGRAIPDIRDGLKPVHRRILYAMYDLKNEWNKPYKKSARVVGDVIGKYHPHGDTAVYDTMVRMAQDFSMRYVLVDGQGNFGSIDGDNAAAMRYTEVRMSKLTGEFLLDIEKETVDFRFNYDNSLLEPVVLPARIPNLLLNGSSGIAVGMATNIPPHNLTEIVSAIEYLIKKPEADIEELLDIIQGPDFPTAGYIYGKKGIREAYLTGRGIIKIRGKMEVEEIKKGGKNQIIVSEIPYQVNKIKLIEKMAELVKIKKIEDIYDIRDESDRDGMRIVIELKKDAIPDVVINQLFSYTQMEMSYGVILLSIVNNRPELLNIKDILIHFISFRKEVVTKRIKYNLNEAEKRAHILLGLKIALDNLDEIIKLIRTSESPKKARELLISRFDLSEIQANAILEMKLQRLTALERDKLIKEYNDILKTIEKYKKILMDENLLLDIISKEMVEIREKYGDKRKTVIIEKTEDINIEDLIANEEMVVTITRSGYIKQTQLNLYHSQRRGGKGLVGGALSDNDFIEILFVASSHDYILFFTSFGRVFWVKVYEMPKMARNAKGRPLVNFLNFQHGEKIATVLCVKEFTENQYVVIATKNGLLKKTSLIAFCRAKSKGIIALTLNDGDEVIGARLTNGEQDIFLVSKAGKSIRFNEQEIRSMGRLARGVKGMNVSPAAGLIGMDVISENSYILVVTENGYGKITPIKKYRLQTRGGIGIFTLKKNTKTGDVVSFRQVRKENDIMIITDGGKVIRISVSGISEMGRATQGVRLINLGENEKVVDISLVITEEHEIKKDDEK